MSSTTANDVAPLLRRMWATIFGRGAWLGVILALMAAAIRGVGMLGPRHLFWVLPIGFVAMALTPFVFFTRGGRRRAGVRLPRRPLWIPFGAVLGILGSLFMYWLGVTLFGATDDNWFVSVRRSFPVTPQMAGIATAQLFWIITIPSLIFSPIGEEAFFRGFLQQVMEERSGHRVAVLIDAGWFAVVHLFHHGLVRVDAVVRFFPVSGVIWMILIFGAGVLFAFLRRKTGSLLAPIVSHAAFNLGMNYTIFYWL